MWAFFVRRPIVAIVIAVLIVVVGVVVMIGLPISQYPSIVPPQVQVRATFLGADARSVEQAVAAPIEQQMSGVRGGLYMQSTSASDGSLVVNVYFDIGTSVDVDTVLAQVRVNQAQPRVPQIVQQLGINVQPASSNFLLLAALYSPKGTYDRTFLANYATIRLSDRLLRIPGVGRVLVFGAADYAMRLWLDPTKLGALGLTVGDVRTALNSQNVTNPGGRLGGQPALPGQDFTYTVLAPGWLVTAEQFGDIVLRTSPDGSVVRVKGVARVELGAASYEQEARFNGQPAVIIATYQNPGTNAIEAVNAIRETLADAAREFPEDMTYQLSLDTTQPVRTGIEEIAVTLGIALGLVILVVFVFLQTARATFIPLVTVPVSLIGAFLLFPLFGFSINTLSLFALVLAIGLVIDDAIVVVEAVEGQIEHGAAPAEATLAAMRLVSGPVVAIALILAAVFIPVGLAGGITGRLNQQFALTIATSVLISAFSALTLSPALSAKMLRPRRRRRGPLAAFFRGFDRAYGWASGHYVRQVEAFARRPWLGLVVLAVAGAAAWLVAGRVRSGFLPDEDEGYFFVGVTLPPASSLDRTSEALRRVEAELADLPGIDSVVAVAGFGILAGVSSPFQGTAFVRLKPWSERTTPETRLEGILDRVRRDLGGMPEARVVAARPAAIPGLGTTGGVALYVQDVSGTLTPQQLEAEVERFLAALRERPEIGSAITTLQASVPQRQATVDPARVLQRGVPVQDVFLTLATYLGGTFVNQFSRFGRVWNVYMQADAPFRMSGGDLRLYLVRDAQGNMVPLSELVRVEAAAGPEFLNRFNLYRAGQVLVNGAPGVGTADVMRAIREVAARSLPRTMSFDWSDLSRQQANAPSAVPTFTLAFVVVFLVLAALYESWSLPFSVLLSTPIAVLGAFLGLLARRLDFDVYAQIGLVMLVGLAAKNAILIVEYARSEVQAGRDPLEAAVDATRIRLRPILMTSFAFILGCLPLWFASGAGAEARRILGTVVITGMLLATLVAPLVVPALFVLVERAAGWRHRREEAAT